VAPDGEPVGVFGDQRRDALLLELLPLLALSTRTMSPSCEAISSK
jgi:hypothetical protein